MQYTAGEQAFILFLHWKSGAHRDRPPENCDEFMGIYAFQIEGPIEKEQTILFRPENEKFYTESMSQDGDVKIGFAIKPSQIPGWTEVYVHVPCRS